MKFGNKIVFSPLELEWLKQHRNDTPIDQISITLAKSRNAIINKLKEFDGKILPGKKNRVSRIGKRKDLGIFCRSAWEANILRYLNHLGWKWMYEPRVFTFEKERKGAISYLPDIYLPEYDTWLEIKGMLPSRDRGAMRKFKKYYPEEFAKLKVITGNPKTKATEFFNKMNIPIFAYYSDINKQYKSIIPNWE